MHMFNFSMQVFFYISRTTRLRSFTVARSPHMFERLLKNLYSHGTKYNAALAWRGAELNNCVYLSEHRFSVLDTTVSGYKTGWWTALSRGCAGECGLFNL